MVESLLWNKQEMMFFLKKTVCFHSPNCEVWRNFFNLEKLAIKSWNYFVKKSFFSFKRHLQQNSRAQTCRLWQPVLILRAILLRKKSKLFHSNGPFPTFLFHPMFANFILANICILFTSEREKIFSSVCSECAVEYNWNSKISQNFKNCRFCKINSWSLRKKLEIFRSP